MIVDGSNKMVILKWPHKKFNTGPSNWTALEHQTHPAPLNVMLAQSAVVGGDTDTKVCGYFDSLRPILSFHFPATGHYPWAECYFWKAFEVLSLLNSDTQNGGWLLEWRVTAMEIKIHRLEKASSMKKNVKWIKWRDGSNQVLGDLKTYCSTQRKAKVKVYWRRAAVKEKQKANVKKSNDDCQALPV